MAKIESAVRVVLKFNDALNHHDVDGMMALMSDDCAFENTFPAPDGTRYVGKAAVGQFWRDFVRDSPHAHFSVEDIFGSGLRCVALWRYDWVNADGTTGHVRGADIFRVSGGLITEKLAYVKG